MPPPVHRPNEPSRSDGDGVSQSDSMNTDGKKTGDKKRGMK